MTKILSGAAVSALILFVLAACGTPAASPSGWKGSPSSPIATAAPVQSGPLTTFGSGTYEVGTGDGQVVPGKYKTAGPGSDSFGSCYWARLKDTGGETGAIIANGNAEGPTVVTIGKGDAAFQTRCTWIKI